MKNTSATFNAALKDNNSQQATFYDLTTDSLFWNRASLICLPKTITASPEIALLYLLQKEAKTLIIWQQQWGNNLPTANEFIEYTITQKRFSNPIGKPISTESFWKEYKGTINGITAEAGFEFTVNEVQKPYKELLQAEDIQSVICFDNTWQEQNYFIETEKEWILYHWASAV